jgi:hypothetical protein
MAVLIWWGWTKSVSTLDMLRVRNPSAGLAHYRAFDSVSYIDHVSERTRLTATLLELLLETQFRHVHYGLAQ